MSRNIRRQAASSSDPAQVKKLTAARGLKAGIKYRMALIDAYGSEVIMTDSFIRYRDRVIDYNAIAVFQVKQRKLLINNFHQNNSLPTMCIYFKTKEEAVNALDVLTDSYYGTSDPVEEDEVEVEPSHLKKSKGWTELLSEFLGL